MSKTPFASSIDIPTDVTRYNPFKPCTHGHFRFTKLNVIDKFGQIIQGVQLYSDVADSNFLNVVQPSTKPLFESAPYTIVEGFLQQKKPFTQPEALPM